MWSGKETGKEEGKVSTKGNSTLVIFKLCSLGHQQQQKLGSSCRCKFSGLGPGLLNQKP